MFGKAWPELVKLAADKGAPVDYVALSFLTVAASLIGSKRQRAVPMGVNVGRACNPMARTRWRPSHNKSPALDPLTGILRRLEEERAG